MYRFSTLIIIVVAMTFALGCGNTTGSTAISDGPPELSSGKGDAIGLTKKGTLEFGQKVTGKIDGEISYHGYTFEAGKGSKVSVVAETKESGKDMPLWVFGPEQNGTFDNNSIESGHSSDGLTTVSGVNLSERGKYMVVVESAVQDPLNYSLTLTCQSDSCTPSVETGETTEDGKLLDIEWLKNNAAGFRFGTNYTQEHADEKLADNSEDAEGELPDSIAKHAESRVEVLQSSEPGAEGGGQFRILRDGREIGYGIDIIYNDDPGKVTGSTILYYGATPIFKAYTVGSDAQTDLEDGEVVKVNGVTKVDEELVQELESDVPKPFKSGETAYAEHLTEPEQFDDLPSAVRKNLSEARESLRTDFRRDRSYRLTEYTMDNFWSFELFGENVGYVVKLDVVIRDSNNRNSRAKGGYQLFYYDSEGEEVASHFEDPV